MHVEGANKRILVCVVILTAKLRAEDFLNRKNLLHCFHRDRLTNYCLQGVVTPI